MEKRVTKHLPILVTSERRIFQWSSKSHRSRRKESTPLLRKLCANYDGGNCLLLDDGEPCVCVQSISKYGIYCNYFKNAVLPVDEGLHAEIMKPTGGKRCVLCRQAFASRAKNQRYCPACAAKQKRLKAAERQRRKRASASRF